MQQASPDVQADDMSMASQVKTQAEIINRNRQVIALLNSWEQEDAEEQRDTLAFLLQALDEDRLSSRKLFS